MPCHNGEKWVGNALRSLSNQTLSNLEIIVIDDGSTDNSLRIIERHAERDSRIQPISLTHNRGIVFALNHGLDVATGRFVARMDSDDVCSPRRLENQFKFMANTNKDLCGSWFIEFGQGLKRATRFPHEESALRASMFFQNSICHPTVLARREVFDKFRYREEYRLAEDYDLFARASSEFRIANVPEVLLHYRRHAQQATQASRDAMEAVTRRIRIEALTAAGISTSAEEQHAHNLIRAPQSIRTIPDLKSIEAWLFRLMGTFSDANARQIIASQWIRACVRAAPLGNEMWKLYRSSPLHAASGANRLIDLDLRTLSLMRLDYASPLFTRLRRLGVSS